MQPAATVAGDRRERARHLELDGGTKGIANDEAEGVPRWRSSCDMTSFRRSAPFNHSPLFVEMFIEPFGDPQNVGRARNDSTCQLGVRQRQAKCALAPFSKLSQHSLAWAIPYAPTLIRPLSLEPCIGFGFL